MFTLCIFVLHVHTHAHVLFSKVIRHARFAACVYACMHALMYVCMYVCMHGWMDVCVCVVILIYIYIYIYQQLLSSISTSCGILVRGN